MPSVSKPFINDRFLLQNETAVRLFRNYAAGQPILDYHGHLPIGDIAGNRRFQNLYEIWLEGDHYKWRAMRANGVPEMYCTGSASPYDKFLAWARTVPNTLRNPLYHWTHLELARYFGITELLNEQSAPRIWNRANEMLQGGLTVHRILEKFGIDTICTTDDPTDTLEHHTAVAASPLRARILPAYRPDRALNTADPDAFNQWCNRLGSITNVGVDSFTGLLDALEKRHSDFHDHGSRLSDHGLEFCFAHPCSEREAAAIYDKVRARKRPEPSESAGFAAFLMVFFGYMDARRGWTKQLHLGALRNVNTRAMHELGRDTGFDCIGDWSQLSALAAYLDLLDRENALPKTIVYNLNPADNYAFAALIGSFASGAGAGKIQYGSAWWFLDQKDGIESQLTALSNCGLLSRFVGMLTDSRSFMSFPRHEYFRRVLCNLLGNEMENGMLPNDEELVGGMLRNICFQNAADYFQFPARNQGTDAATIPSEAGARSGD